jgi:hypothetical protein
MPLIVLKFKIFPPHNNFKISPTQQQFASTKTRRQYFAQAPYETLHTPPYLALLEGPH